MARSITSDEVHNAADVLLAAGTRPTVERIRLALGRGSPNTIGPMLEGWWTQVSQRLQHQLTLPDVPEAVAAVMARVWETALETSRTQAESALAPMRALDRPAFRRHPVAIIHGNDRGVYGQQQAVHG